MQVNQDPLFELYRAALSRRRKQFCTQVRDLTKIDLGQGYALMIAVDSDGGIGPLEHDTVQCSAYQLGRFAMRVPLLELLASGARPLAAFDMLTVPMQPHGTEIIRGIRDELHLAGLGRDFPLSGSTEDNVPTTMTGIGTTVIGLVHETDLRPGTSQAGDAIICIGVPKSGPEDKVTLIDKTILQQKEFRKVLQIEGIHDILPVGSRGVAYEAGELARLAGLELDLADAHAINIKKSAGPATCVLVSCTNTAINQIRQQILTPIFFIGRLLKQGEVR